MIDSIRDDYRHDDRKSKHTPLGIIIFPDMIGIVQPEELCWHIHEDAILRISERDERCSEESQDYECWLEECIRESLLFISSACIVIEVHNIEMMT